EGHKYVKCPSKYQIDQDFKDILSLKLFELFKVMNIFRTSKSDVDLCITTKSKEVDVFMLANVLKK
ncbi:18730_t:CDS:2, partial [Gigaspora rosea]